MNLDYAIDLLMRGVEAIQQNDSDNGPMYPNPWAPSGDELTRLAESIEALDPRSFLAFCKAVHWGTRHPPKRVRALRVMNVALIHEEAFLRACAVYNAIDRETVRRWHNEMRPALAA